MPTREYRKYKETNTIPLNITAKIPMEKKKRKESKLKYYLFCIKWLWKNRNWDNTRQKFKAMEKAYRKKRKVSK